MEGRAIARPDGSTRVAAWPRLGPLQWRAGQLPGRTSCPAPAIAPSMELQWRAGQLPGRTSRGRYVPQQRGSASMEGRAIARPDRRARSALRRRSRCFNGGPGNCPAGRVCGKPGLASSICFNGGPGNCPAGRRRRSHRRHRVQHASMEGRAIARPDRLGRHGRTRRSARFNGGPGNCPAGR